MFKKIIIKTLLLSSVLISPIVFSQSLENAQKTNGLAVNFDECKRHFPDGYIPYRKTNNPADDLFELCFNDFAVLYSGFTKTPLYAVEHITAQELRGPRPKRSNEFYEDVRIPKAKRATLADYANSNYDRGHFAAAGNRDNQLSMDQSFALTNIAPQARKLNRGTWAKIETDTRNYVLRTNRDVYVFTGMVFSMREIEYIGNQVVVPDAFYKVVYDATPGAQRAWAYWNTNADASINMKPITMEEFINRSGLRLLDKIPKPSAP